MILPFLVAASAVPDCSKLKGAANDRCALAVVEQIGPAPNCATRKTQYDMNECSFRDYLHADIELNDVWDRVAKRLAGQPKIFATVVAGQRAWLSYRDKQCDVWAQLYSGGTIVPLAINSCLLDITNFRTKELKQFVDNK